MAAFPHRPVPDDLLAWFGDCRWRDRPGPFEHPFCRGAVPDLGAALDQLDRLYDASTVRRLVADGHAQLVIGLFGGLTPWVDRLLQLGADLDLCRGWARREKLVGSLRSPRGFEGARFEVGVWAGLCRAGLEPAVEPAAGRDKARADFLVEADGVRVALELKALSDSAFERNRYLVSQVVGNMFVRVEGPRLRGEVVLTLSDEGLGLLDEHQSFFENCLPRFEAELLEALPRVAIGTTTPLRSLGAIRCDGGPDGDPPGSFAGGWLVDAGQEADPVSRVRRALYRVKQSERQLSATPADIRVAVIWGSTDELPAHWSAEVAAHVVHRDAETWSKIPVDWVVFLNGYRHAGHGHWTTEAAACRLPHAQREISPRVLRGLTDWGVLWRGPVNETVPGRGLHKETPP